MPLKKSSPIQLLKKDHELYKRKVEDFIKECEKKKYADEKDKSSNKFKKVVKRGDDLATDCSRILERAEILEASNEPKQLDDFEELKKKILSDGAEVQISLNKTLKNIQAIEDDKVTKEEDEAEEEEEDEEAEEEEDEIEEEEEETNNGKSETKDKPEERLDSKKLEQSYSEDEEEGDEEEDEEEEDEEEEDEEEEEEEEASEVEEEDDDEEEGQDHLNGNATLRVFEAILDFEKQQDEDLGFKIGEKLTILSTRSDGWWEATNESGIKGMVPSTYLKECDRLEETVEKIEAEELESTAEEESPKEKRSGKQLWKGIKDAIKETSATDVLHVFGAVPAGFRVSTLGKLQTDDANTLKSYLAPKLSASNVFYKDLFLNPSTNKIRARNARVQRIFQIQSCRQIPLPGTGIQVLGRCIRICLFDGTNILSNIIVLRAGTVDKEMKTWGCNLKVTDIMKSLDYGEFFVRTNSTEAELGILFELSYQFTRESGDGQEGEMSLGWAHLPLFEQNGGPVANKTYDIAINGGTPYEKGVEVDPDIGKTAGSNRFRSLMSSKKQPRLFVKVFMPNKEQKEQLDTLPDVIVSNSLFIPFLSYYRQILADELLRDRVDINSTEIIHNPLLVSFLTAVETPDIMDALRLAWSEKLKNTRRQDKREHEQLKDIFSQVYMEAGYALVHINSMPGFVLGNQQIEDRRLGEINKVARITREKRTVLAALLSPDICYKPFNIKELSFEVTGPYCLVNH